MRLKTGNNLATEVVEGRAGKTRVLVIGVGNILLRDEGIGVHIAQRLHEQELGDNVEVIDAGTASLDVLLSQEKPYKLIVVDAARGGEEPGTIYKTRLGKGEASKLTRVFSEDKGLKISSHQFGLIDALAAAEKMNCAPEEIVIIGVEPKEMDYGLEPTREVGEKITEIIKTVLEEF